MRELTANPTDALTGSIRVPGDKSVSHRALMLSGLAVGETQVRGLLEGEDVLRSAAAMRAMGAEAERAQDGTWHIRGRGLGALVDPDDVLDLGNSGTGARLLMGVIAGHDIQAVLTGDASLRSRPMKRVAAPLEQMGARILARNGGLMPLTVMGSASPLPIEYRLPVASAQVKSAILLAGLNAPGETSVLEPAPTRDHTERMLRYFGAELEVRDEEEAGQGSIRRVTLRGQPELTGGGVIQVPADPSSAAFPLVAASILPGSEVRIAAVGLNPLRTGLFKTLEEMGAKIAYENVREEGGEAIADLVVRAGPLQGVEVPAERAPSMIDEYPILAVAAAVAEGRTVMQGLGELRVKESDRLAAMAQGLAACGVQVEEGPDSLVVHGAGTRPKGGGQIATQLDHRIAMAFLVLGLAAEKPITVDDAGPIDTSFPGFEALMAELGADLSGLQGR